MIAWNVGYWNVGTGAGDFMGPGAVCYDAVERLGDWTYLCELWNYTSNKIIENVGVCLYYY